MEIKPDIVKTIKRLSSQGKNDVLKNKLRAWLQTKDFSLDDLFFNCNEGTISLSSGLLNKLGTLYSSGKEGLMEDNEAAFAFFEMASELGHSGACGNCAQYYFDGRAPEGKDIEMAHFYCLKAIELGLDKYMLMGEILYDQNQYSETVKWLHMLLDNKTANRTRKQEARILERQCLFKQLNRVFHKLNTVSVASSVPQNATLESLRLRDPQSRSSTPSRGLLALARAPPTTPRSPRSSSKVTITVPSDKGRAKSPTNGSSSNNFSTTGLSSSVQKMQLSSSSPFNNKSNSIESASAGTTTPFSPYDLPGWFRISDDIDGFDKNSCTALTARAEMLELEAHAVRAACDTAQEHVVQARRNNMAEDIIALLVDTKVKEFKEIYASVVANKELHIACWDAYTDTQEQIIRRQLNTEQAFFNPRTCANRLTQRLAERLLRKRTSEEPVDGLAEPFVLNLAPDELDGMSLVNRTPTARCMITAERSLLDLAADIYAPVTYTIQAPGSSNPGTSSGSSASFTATTTAASTTAAPPTTTKVQLRYTGWTLPENASLSAAASNALADSSVEANNTPATPSRAGARSVSPMKTSTTAAAGDNNGMSKMGGVNASAANGGGASSGGDNTNGNSNVNGALRAEPVGELTPPEVILLDTTLLHYRVRTCVPLAPTVKNLHQSGYLAEDVGNSDEVLSFFNKITMVAEDPVYVENEKILAQMIMRFAHDGRPIQLHELQLLNPECLEQDKVQMDRVCFHYFIRRVVKWVVPPQDEANKYLMLPIASVQGRALQLIEAGIITLAEAFDKDGLYGVFYCDEQAHHSHHHHHHSAEHHHYPHYHQHNHNHLTTTLHNKGHGQLMSLHHTTSSHHVSPLSALRNKVKHINALYQKYIVELQPKNFLPTIQFWKVHTTGATVPSYRLLYTELSRMYGGESDDGADVNAVCNSIASADRAMHEMLQKLQS